MSFPVEQANMECSQFVDANQQILGTPSLSSNKRKSDNHIDSNVDEKKNCNMRKNIRGINDINKNNFDTITIAAQREESERLARVQGLKSSFIQKCSNGTLETIEDIYDTELYTKELDSECGTPDILQEIKSITPDSEENKDPVEQKENIKKLYNNWFSSEKSPSIKTKTDDVVTIDSSSDDDCIILSDSDDCMDEDSENDQTNSGLHVKDVLNIPNENGKVIVNIGHVESEPDIFMAPQIARIIKPHQIGGVRFLFDNIIESTKRFNSSSGFGCILAHSMGLGKTLQVVTFCDIFLRHTDAKCILCIMPINTIQNWQNEFNMWLPTSSDNLEEIRPREFPVYALNDQHKTMNSRSNVILRWSSEGGVLLMGYELFRVLALKVIKNKNDKKHFEMARNKKLLDQIYTALVKPGPDLVICDEGHRIKNVYAGISIALKQINSRRRIVLTGYPLQNNLLEYWCMVDFVRPNYLGSKTEFSNMFERPIQNGQCIDSTPEDIKLMRYRAHVLHSLLVGFVQRRSDAVLQSSLPQKHEYVILTKMTEFQRKLYDTYMNEVVRKKKIVNPLKAFAVCCKIWNHPDVLHKFLKRNESDADLDIMENCPPQKNFINSTALPNSNSCELSTTEKESWSTKNLIASDESLPKDSNVLSESSLNLTFNDDLPLATDYLAPVPRSVTDNEESLHCSSEILDLDANKEEKILKIDTTQESISNVKEQSQFSDTPKANANMKMTKSQIKFENDTISYSWALDLLKTYEPGQIDSSPKMQIFMCILEESIKCGDRVLVFSQSLLTLNSIESFLQGMNIPESESLWKKNASYFRLDGSTSALEREKLVTEFNTNSDIKLFLISTKAGSLGINLTGANRVVVFDASWNPCHDTQAVHRIYRYGQRKPCFVYRIVMDYCLEKNIYDRQVKKIGMADRVVDECNPDAHFSIKELANLCYDNHETMQTTEIDIPLEKYSDEIMRTVITKYKSALSKEPFYHESLLIDRKEKQLSQTEKRLAKRSYEIEKKATNKICHFLPNNFRYKPTQIMHCPRNQQHLQTVNKTVRESASDVRYSRWIPAEVWQKQGMSSQEMRLPIDVAIPTNSKETPNIFVKAGQKVMVLNSPKGVYMQLENGKIIAIKSSILSAEKKEQLDRKKIKYFKEPDKRPFNAARVFKNLIPCNKPDDDDVIVIEDSINETALNSQDPSNSLKSPNSPKSPKSPKLPNSKCTNKPEAINTTPNKGEIFNPPNSNPMQILNEFHKDDQSTLPSQASVKHPETEFPIKSKFLEDLRSNLFETENNIRNDMAPLYNGEKYYDTSMFPKRPEKKFPETVKISNIPAPNPSISSVSHSHALGRTEYAENPICDTINAAERSSSYMQTYQDNIPQHAHNFSFNNCNNYMAKPPEHVTPINAPYHYNNAPKPSYNNDYYNNYSDYSHSNYQQVSKYLYGYYQPQTPLNTDDKVRNSEMFSTLSTQCYLQRPSTYNKISKNNDDMDLNSAPPCSELKREFL